MVRAWKFMVAGVALVVLGGGVALAASSGSSPSPAPATPTRGTAGTLDRGHDGRRHLLFSRLSNAELTVTIGGTDHHIRIDRGTVQSVSSSEVVLKELDGSVVTVAVNADTRVVVDGRQASIADVKQGYVGIAIRDGDSPARALRVHDPSQWPGASLGAGGSVSGP